MPAAARHGEGYGGCFTNRNLRTCGRVTPLTTVGPASVKRVLSASDTDVPVTDHLPATRSSSMAAADPAAPTGLGALIARILADRMDQYTFRSGNAASQGFEPMALWLLEQSIPPYH